MNIQLEARYFFMNRPVSMTFAVNDTPCYYQELKEIWKIAQVDDCNLIRLGNQNDGGYVMLDSIPKGTIAYSFGIGNDVSWDLAMAQCGCEIFMYDHTIDKLPQENEHFHFSREGITDKPDSFFGKSLDTLENFIIRNQHTEKNGMVLKMDVEGAEWNFLETVSTHTLNQFDQIVFEFHNLCTCSSLESMSQIIRALKKLSQTHTLVHLHGNNTGIALKNDIGYFPNTMEATYARTASHTFHENENILLPISLDAPNVPQHSEIPLGYWNQR